MTFQIRSRHDAQRFLTSGAFRPLGNAPGSVFSFSCGEPQEAPDTQVHLYRWSDGCFSVMRSGVIGGHYWRDEEEEVLRDPAGWVYARRAWINKK